MLASLLRQSDAGPDPRAPLIGGGAPSTLGNAGTQCQPDGRHLRRSGPYARASPSLASLPKPAAALHLPPRPAAMLLRQPVAPLGGVFVFFRSPSCDIVSHPFPFGSENFGTPARAARGPLGGPGETTFSKQCSVNRVQFDGARTVSVWLTQALVGPRRWAYYC